MLPRLLSPGFLPVHSTTREGELRQHVWIPRRMQRVGRSNNRWLDVSPNNLKAAHCQTCEPPVASELVCSNSFMPSRSVFAKPCVIFHTSISLEQGKETSSRLAGGGRVLALPADTWSSLHAIVCEECGPNDMNFEQESEAWPPTITTVARQLPSTILIAQHASISGLQDARCCLAGLRTEKSSARFEVQGCTPQQWNPFMALPSLDSLHNQLWCSQCTRPMCIFSTTATSILQDHARQTG